MPKKIAFDKHGDPYLSDEETSVAENLRIIGQSTNEQTFDLTAIPKSTHELRQEGAYITCATPGHRHGSYVGPDKNLVRLSDGSYRLETVE